MKAIAAVVVAFLVISLVIPCHSMDLTHYDVESLAYLSTDIVVATLSENEQHQFTAIVMEALYGSLHPGDRIEKLEPFLTFFRPMKNGMKVVLFLDRRPRQYDFFHADAAKAPFAVPPSGVYLIDAYDHVHEYFQGMNPGPYVAQGYSFAFHVAEPTREQDLALPSLTETKARITESLKRVETLRPLLDKVPTPGDAPALFSVLDNRSTKPDHCMHRETGDAITERAAEQVSTLQDPELLLRLHRYRVGPRYNLSFVQRGVSPDPQFTAARVAYLLEALADKKRDISFREAAAEILIYLNRFKQASQGADTMPWLINNEWLMPAASKIRTIAESIFLDASEDSALRGLCVRLVSLDQPDAVEKIKGAYDRSSSPELRFAIEDYLLELGDNFYEKLSAPGRAFASLVVRAPETSCANLLAHTPAFIAKYRESKTVRDRVGLSGQTQIVLTNLQSGARASAALIKSFGGWSGGYDGESWFELQKLSDLPAGDYSLRMEYRDNSSVLGTGYPLVISLTEAKSWDIEVKQ